MTDPLRRPIVAELRAQGWVVDRTRGGHLRADHPNASMPVFLSATPSSRRDTANTRALARRALRGDLP